MPLRRCTSRKRVHCTCDLRSRHTYPDSYGNSDTYTESKIHLSQDLVLHRIRARSLSVGARLESKPGD